MTVHDDVTAKGGLPMTRLRLGGALAGLAAALLATSLATSTAAARELRAAGAPADLTSGQSGYFVWNDDHEVHLRMSDSDPSTTFRGTLRTAGKLANLVHDGDRHDLHVAISGNGHVVHFRAMPGTALDGFKVRVEDSPTVDLGLKRDGAAAPTDQIRLGSNDEHPDSSTFTLRV
jgi:hypothetical protein